MKQNKTPRSGTKNATNKHQIHVELPCPPSPWQLEHTTFIQCRNNGAINEMK